MKKNQKRYVKTVMNVNGGKPDSIVRTCSSRSYNMCKNVSGTDQDGHRDLQKCECTCI